MALELFIFLEKCRLGDRGDKSTISKSIREPWPRG